jgi:FkbM family methyltransferase
LDTPAKENPAQNVVIDPGASALLAAQLALIGQRLPASQVAMRGLAHLTSGAEGAVPQTLLNLWEAPTLEALLLRQCLAYACYSSYYSQENSLSWLLRWCKLEKNNPEPFLRFGMLAALKALLSGQSAPPAALKALVHAQSKRRDRRAELVLELLVAGFKEVALPYDGGEIWALPDLRNASTYILLEQGDWFEEDLKLFRLLARPGRRVLDLGANIGCYALSAARRVGPAGRVIAVEPAQTTCALLRKSAQPFLNLTVLQAAVSEQSGAGRLELGPSSELNRLGEGGVGETVQILSVDELACSAGIEEFDVIKMDVEGHEQQTLNGAQQIIGRGAPIIIYEVKDGERWHLDLIERFRALGYESYFYCAGLNTLFNAHKLQLDPYVLNMVAVKPQALPRLREVAAVR